MVGQQTWESSNRQESQSTTLPAQPGPVFSSPPTKEGPWLQGAGTSLHWAALPCITSAPARAPPGLPFPAGTWRGPCG